MEGKNNGNKQDPKGMFEAFFGTVGIEFARELGDLLKLLVNVIMPSTRGNERIEMQEQQNKNSFKRNEIRDTTRLSAKKRFYASEAERPEAEPCKESIVLGEAAFVASRELTDFAKEFHEELRKRYGADYLTNPEANAEIWSLCDNHEWIEICAKEKQARDALNKFKDRKAQKSQKDSETQPVLSTNEVEKLKTLIADYNTIIDRLSSRNTELRAQGKRGDAISADSVRKQILEEMFELNRDIKSFVPGGYWSAKEVLDELKSEK